MQLFSFGEIIMSLVTNYLIISDRSPHPVMSKKQKLYFEKEGMMLMLLMLSFALSFNTLHDLAQQQGLRA